MKYWILLTLTFFSHSILLGQNKIKIERDTSFTLNSAYTKELKKRPYIEKVYSNLPSNVVEYKNIIYSKPYEGRSLKLNLYRPNDKKKYPVLLLVHGGGWNSGDYSMEIPMAEQIASYGYVTIPIEYRLSPEAVYPAAVYDLKTAIRWVRKNAKKYGMDDSKIAISGTSAGGQLAALVGVTNGQEKYENKKEYTKQSSIVQAVINIDGITDFTTDESLEGVKTTLAKNKVSASVKWLDGTIDTNKDNWIAASSLFHITSKSAPICFINSAIPRFHDGRDESIEKLNQYNIYSEVHTIPDTPHPFWLFNPWFKTTVNYMVNYLDKVFKNDSK